MLRAGNPPGRRLPSAVRQESLTYVTISWLNVWLHERLSMLGQFSESFFTRWWPLPAFLLFTWSLWFFAIVLATAVTDRRDPLPDGSHRGTSGLALVLISALVVWGIAKLIDFVVPHWGTTIVVCLHAAYALMLVRSILIDYRILRQ
jgi:hypothetical protein